MGGFSGIKGKRHLYNYIIILKIKNIIENKLGKQSCSYNPRNKQNLSQHVKNLNIENYKPVKDDAIEDGG